LIREAMQWLADLKAAALEPIRILDREDKKIFLAPDGQLTEVQIPAGPFRHEVYTLDDFAAAVDRWSGQKSVVFHDERGAVLVVDDSCRRDAVTLPLRTTAVWKRILQLENQVFDQRGFLRLLRFDLASIIPGSLVSAIQKIEVVTSGSQRTEMSPGRERGTREFAADLQASGEIPERVTCQLPVYLLEGLNYGVPVTFGLDYTLPPCPVSFVFRPLPDEIERTLLQMQGDFHRLLVESIHANLAEEDPLVPVLYGSAAP